MWWQKRDNEAGCWVFSHPKKLCMNIEHPWKSASFLLMKDLLWKTLIIIDPAEKWWWVFILHLLCQLLMGIIMPLYIRVKSTKNIIEIQFVGHKGYVPFPGQLQNYYWCAMHFNAILPLHSKFFCFNWPCQFHFLYYSISGTTME